MTTFRGLNGSGALLKGPSKLGTELLLNKDELCDGNPVENKCIITEVPEGEVQEAQTMVMAKFKMGLNLIFIRERCCI